MLFLRRAPRRRIAVIAQSVTAVEPLRTGQAARQRLLGSLIHRRANAAEIGGVQRISSGLLDLDIAGHRGDCNHALPCGAQGHDQCHGVVRCCIRVDQNCFGHGSQNSKLDKLRTSWGIQTLAKSGLLRL